MPIDRLYQTFRQQFFLHRFIDLHASLTSLHLQTLLGLVGFIQNLFQVVFEVILRDEDFIENFVNCCEFGARDEVLGLQTAMVVLMIAWVVLHVGNWITLFEFNSLVWVNKRHYFGNVHELMPDDWDKIREVFLLQNVVCHCRLATVLFMIFPVLSLACLRAVGGYFALGALFDLGGHGEAQLTLHSIFINLFKMSYSLSPLR